MRTKKYIKERKDTNYNLSIGDLMIALCALLALATVIFAIQLQEAQEKLKERTWAYVVLQRELREAFHEEFDKDLKKWDAEITEEGVIKFNKTEVLFTKERAELQEQYKQILSDFFPRLIALLYQPRFRDNIEEIRIEGHTAVDRFMSKDKDYITGMKLSQQRTTNVMLFCLDTVPEQREWVQKNIAAIGYSNSRSIKDNVTITKKESSRRVDFRINTKADAVLKGLAKEFDWHE